MPNKYNMTESKLFNHYREVADKSGAPKNRRESIEWFRNRLRKDKQINDIKKVTEGLRMSAMFPGSMLIYEYDAKFKKKLPYWDRFPLVIYLQNAPGGWYGANLHYLPPRARSALLYELNVGKNSLAKIAKAMEQNPLTKFCLKRYLFANVKSTPVAVPKDEWEIAISLPFENFQKASNREVWKKAR